MEKSKIFNDEDNSINQIAKIQDDAKLIITHIAKFDTEKIKIYLEDLRLFFNVHNHPEIKIIGRNIVNPSNDNIKKNLCLIQDKDNYITCNQINSRNDDNNRTKIITKCNNPELDKDLSQTIDSDYLNNRKKELKENVFYNNYYDQQIKNSNFTQYESKNIMNVYNNEKFNNQLLLDDISRDDTRYIHKRDNENIFTNNLNPTYRSDYNDINNNVIKLSNSEEYVEQESIGGSRRNNADNNFERILKTENHSIKNTNHKKFYKNNSILNTEYSSFNNHDYFFNKNKNNQNLNYKENLNINNQSQRNSSNLPRNILKKANEYSNNFEEESKFYYKKEERRILNEDSKENYLKDLRKYKKININQDLSGNYRGKSVGVLEKQNESRKSIKIKYLS